MRVFIAAVNAVIKTFLLDKNFVCCCSGFCCCCLWAEHDIWFETV